MVLYHGNSVCGIEELNPCSAAHDDPTSPVVYLTPNRAYALFYIRDREINYVTCGVTAEGYIRYDERFPEQLETLYKGMSGYLYRCKDNGALEPTSTRGVWLSKKPVEIESCEFIPDVYSEILKYEKSGDVKVIRYETLSDGEKHEVYKMIVRSLYKSGLTNVRSKKSDFYRKHFPEAWEFVKNNPQFKELYISQIPQ